MKNSIIDIYWCNFVTMKTSVHLKLTLRILGWVLFTTYPIATFQAFLSQTELPSAVGSLTTHPISQPLLPQPETDFECFPSPSTENQYVVGFGPSLQQASKQRIISGAGDTIPVKIHGYTRHWHTRAELIGLGMTYLGVRVGTREDFFNGGYFKIPNNTVLAQYDARKLFYCRGELNPDLIEVLVNKLLPKGQYWTYLTKSEFDALPSWQFPIVQSYVDVFLEGCMELEEKYKLPGFADTCMNTTTGWENPWVNDRIYPRRPAIFFPRARSVDMLLQKHAQQAFNNIVVE